MSGKFGNFPGVRSVLGRPDHAEIKSLIEEHARAATEDDIIRNSMNDNRLDVAKPENRERIDTLLKAVESLQAVVPRVFAQNLKKYHEQASTAIMLFDRASILKSFAEGSVDAARATAKLQSLQPGLQIHEMKIVDGRVKIIATERGAKSESSQRPTPEAEASKASHKVRYIVRQLAVWHFRE